MSLCHSELRSNPIHYQLFGKFSNIVLETFLFITYLTITFKLTAPLYFMQILHRSAFTTGIWKCSAILVLCNGFHHFLQKNVKMYQALFHNCNYTWNILQYVCLYFPTALYSVLYTKVQHSFLVWHAKLYARPCFEEQLVVVNYFYMFNPKYDYNKWYMHIPLSNTSTSSYFDLDNFRRW